MKLIFKFSLIPILLLSCSSTVIRTYDYYKYLPEGKQGFDNNLIVEISSKMTINLKSKIIVIESGNDLIDTLLIKSPFKSTQFKSKLNTQSLIVYSRFQNASGIVQLDEKGCLVVLRDSKWYLNKSIISKKIN